MKRYFAFFIATAISFLCLPASAQQAALPNAPEVSATPKPRAETALPRFELGPTAFFIYREETHGDQEHDFGFGVRFTYNAFSHLSFEAEYDGTPYESERATPIVGGRLDAAFFGVKSGIRWRKWGLFAKFRPGFLSYGAALKSITGTPLGNNFFANAVTRSGRFTEPAFDTGGGLELYVSRHVLVRYDFGEMIVHHGSLTIPEFGTPFTLEPSIHSDFSFSTGMAFRF